MSTRKTFIDSDDLIRSLKVQAAIAREERAKSEALFASIGEGVIATDEKGRVIRVNQRALDILGYEQHELMGKWFPKKVQAVNEDGASIPYIDRPVARVFLNGESITEQTYYVRKDGTRVPVELTVSPVMMRSRPIGTIEIFRDITFENEMDRLKADFISLASHQLRTPLASVQTYTNMLLQGYVGKLNQQQQAFLNTILNASERMNELISTLLNITRVEAGNLMVHSGSVVLNTMLEELVADLAPLTTEKHLTIELENGGQDHIIDSDPALIQEILVNLLTNAIKYTPDDGTITVQIKHDGRQLLVAVSDTGYGIPLADQAHIFTKFYRASNILKRDTTGTGLGLYLTKNIAERLGGELWFTSHENQGTTFYLSLPMGQAANNIS